MQASLSLCIYFLNVADCLMGFEYKRERLGGEAPAVLGQVAAGCYAQFGCQHLKQEALRHVFVTLAFMTGQ